MPQPRKLWLISGRELVPWDTKGAEGGVNLDLRSACPLETDGGVQVLGLGLELRGPRLRTETEPRSVIVQSE